MKTSIRARLHHRVDYAGRYALVVRVVHNRRSSTVTTPYRLLPAELDARHDCAVASGSRGREYAAFIREVNDYLTTCIRVLRSAARRLEERGRPYLCSEVTAAYRHGTDNRYFETYAGHVIAELESLGRFGTAQSYRSLVNAFTRFRGSRSYRFDQLDAATVSAFEKHLELRGNKRNTVSFYLRTLRALYNRAKAEGYVPPNKKPFAGISFKAADTAKLAVSRSLLRRIAAAELDDGVLAEARDLFMFSFYARGMSFVDLAYLQRDDIWNGAIHYDRNKTHQAFNVSVTRPMHQIMTRYNDPASPWVFPCMARGMREAGLGACAPGESFSGAQLYDFYRRALHYYLERLKEVSGRLGCRRLTFNVARHSWASQAQELGVPVQHISQGLGHTSERTTRIYLAGLGNPVLDKINEKVTKL